MNVFPAAWAARDLFDRGGPVRLRVISLHNHVMNLQVDEWDHLFMIADPGMYRGPASVGMGLLDFRAVQSCVKPGDLACFRDEGIEFYGKNDFRVTLSSAERVSFSVPHNVEFDEAAISDTAVAQKMAELAAPHLCSCLFADGRGSSADPFAETMAREFPRFVRALALGDQAEFWGAFSCLVGLGYGSTPTCDDLMHGALIALHYLKRTTRLAVPLPTLPRSIGAKTTLLGAHMLEMGARGLTAEPVRDFALNLLSGKPIEPSFAGLRRMGSDSGCSIATGLYLMLLECVQK